MGLRWDVKDSTPIMMFFLDSFFCQLSVKIIFQYGTILLNQVTIYLEHNISISDNKVYKWTEFNEFELGRWTSHRILICSYHLFIEPSLDLAQIH